MKKFIYGCLVSLWFTQIGVAQTLSSKTFSQDGKNERLKAIKINLLSPFYSTLSLSYQRVINTETSFQLTFSYMDFDSRGSTENTNANQVSNRTSTSTTNGNTVTEVNTYFSILSQRTQGVAFTPEYRFLLNGRNLTGIYIAPFGRYMFYNYSRQLDKNIQTVTYPVGQPYNSTYTFKYDNAGSDKFTYHTIGFGLTIGKQILFKNKVLFDFFAGPSYSILVNSNIVVNGSNDIVIGSGIPNTYIRGYGVRAGITIGLAH